MLTYLSKEHLSILKPTWIELISLIEKALISLNQGDFAQPIKPYLRYRNLNNRIIAMPAFVGGNFNIAGIKWIASFPDNIHKNLPRAHALTILNQENTGQPLAILSSNELSGIRTAAVSGFAIQRFLDQLPAKDIEVGMTGFGPIGQFHADMVSELLKDRLKMIRVYDVQHHSHQQSSSPNPNIQFVDSWQEAYRRADIFITCTTSKDRYINLPPKKVRCN